MQDQLQQFLARQWPDATEITIEGFAVIAGGYSEETFRFDAHIVRGGERRTHAMILRKDPPPAANILPTSRQSEHDLLLAVRQHTNIPVSDSYFVEMDRTTFGEAAMLIERVRGSGEPSALFNGGPSAGQLESVATHLCELIAELHLCDMKKLNPNGALDDPRGIGLNVATWDDYMSGMFDYYIKGYPSLAFDPLPIYYDSFIWMRRNKPRPLPLVLAHGDFNPANFLYENGKVTALIDWENAHVGDPREDLGWMKQMDMLSATDIFGAVKVDGGFLGHYNKITGFGVTPEEVEYFRLFSSGNIGIPVVSAVKRRVDREHEELLQLYIFQPVVGSMAAIPQLLNYPMFAAQEA